MSDTPAPASPAATTPAVPSGWTDPTFVVKVVGAAILGGAVLALDLTGHAANSQFITLVAVPGLTALLGHTAAKSLN